MNGVAKGSLHATVFVRNEADLSLGAKRWQHSADPAEACHHRKTELAQRCVADSCNVMPFDGSGSDVPPIACSDIESLAELDCILPGGTTFEPLSSG